MSSVRTRDATSKHIAYDWKGIGQLLDAQGNAVIPGLLSARQCETLVDLYEKEGTFRSRIVMARYGFGQGEYKYFSYPLPSLLDQLRHDLYRGLVPTANQWNQQLNINVRYPDELDDFLSRCHHAGQTRPTPLMLQYGEGDYNCLHQDLYGEHVFPLQVTILLSKPSEDFFGGEFVMTERAARSQQRVEVIPLRQGDAVIFAVNQRPTIGKRGFRRVVMRHGVSRIRSGMRYTVGLIFHDAQ